jgi:glutathione-regulated potassium-efflux system ancillary protein KefC
VPTVWAVFLVLLIPLRPALYWLLERAGHGELLLLFGLMVGIGGAELFDLVHVKGDLGALLLGILLAPHTKSGELSKALLGLKDLFLVGFFLSIGLGGVPGLDAVPVIALLLGLLLFKGFLFEQLLLAFRLRARTAFLSSLTLANYSEFGLIVAAIAAKNAWLPDKWLGIIALVLALSFVAVSPLNARSHALYEFFSPRLRRQERKRRIPAEREIDPGDADSMVVGMGRVGTGAFDTLKQVQCATRSAWTPIPIPSPGIWRPVATWCRAAPPMPTSGTVCTWTTATSSSCCWPCRRYPRTSSPPST